MGEMTIRGFDDRELASLNEAATRCGRDPDALARDMIVYFLAAGPRAKAADHVLDDAIADGDREHRLRLAEELRDIRAMTLKPLRSDSTLLIRELRDADG